MQSARSKLRSIASAAAAIALALYIAPSFAGYSVIWDSSQYGDFGLVITPPPTVQSVTPRSPAYEAGIRPGDTLDRPQSLRDQFFLGWLTPHPGERLTISVLHQGRRQRATLVARPLAALSAADSVALALQCIWLLVSAVIAFVLVMIRPSRMTWGFYLVALSEVLLVAPPPPLFSHAPIDWALGYTFTRDLIAPAGAAGFLIFCVLFPSNTPIGWRATVERLAPYLFIPLAGVLVTQDISGIQFVPFPPSAAYALAAAPVAMYLVAAAVLLKAFLAAPGPKREQIKWILLALGVAVILSARDVFVAPTMYANGQAFWSVVAITVLGTSAVVVNYATSRGLERERIKWVVFGFLCFLIATAVDYFGWNFVGAKPWYISVFELLNVVLPITVLYAVLRHRVIDVRFVVSRSLAVGVVVAAVALIVVGIDWLFSTRLPNSRLEAAAYVGVALLVGFSLNAARLWIGKTIDFVFFRPWYRTRERAQALADALRRAAFKSDLYEPLTAGVAESFSLASVALFERVEDGGFVRAAARGWPAGTIWHILPDDPLVLRAGRSSHMADLDVVQWHELDLPPGVARPIAMLPIVAGKMVPAMLLCSAHVNGAAIDPDELRAIRSLCADAGLTYAILPAPQSLGSAFLDQRREPLGA